MKWYQYDQNNSGGWHACDDKVCHRVFIEAYSEKEANSKAEELGIYFDGVDAGRDCGCCGDRWHEPYGAMEFPISGYKNGEGADLMTYVQYLADEYGWTSPDARLYHHDGTVTEVFGGNDE